MFYYTAVLLLASAKISRLSIEYGTDCFMKERQAGTQRPNITTHPLTAEKTDNLTAWPH